MLQFAPKRNRGRAILKVYTQSDAGLQAGILGLIIAKAGTGRAGDAVGVRDMPVTHEGSGLPAEVLILMSRHAFAAEPYAAALDIVGIAVDTDRCEMGIDLAPQEWVDFQHG